METRRLFVCFGDDGWGIELNVVDAQTSFSLVSLMGATTYTSYLRKVLRTYHRYYAICGLTLT